MTRRRWIADEWSGSGAALTGEQANHLARVLRAEVGQIYDVGAGGFLHRASVVAVEAERVEFALHEELETDAALPLHLYLAVFKFDHLEWAIEKATELGVAEITPVLARRTEKHLAQAAVKRVERWRRIAHEASQQARRTDVPVVGDPVGLSAMLGAVTAGTKVLLSETEQTVSLRDVLVGVDEFALAIGPEGGWAPQEMALFAQSGWKAVTLGPRILRAETAAVAAVAIVGAVLG